jgi:hypothetical protein
MPGRTGPHTEQFKYNKVSLDKSSVAGPGCLSRIRIFTSRNLGQKDSGSRNRIRIKEFKYPEPDLDIIPIPDPMVKKHRIPDPGVTINKAPDPGSEHWTRERNIVTNYGKFSFLPMAFLKFLVITVIRNQVH